jgi:CrcB protein
VANLVGGYLIGIGLGFFGSYPGLSPEWRLFAITGFLGGLTTFSSFSGEAMVLLQRGDYGWALAHSGAHLLGSIVCCVAGFATWRAIA